MEHYFLAYPLSLQFKMFPKILLLMDRGPPGTAFGGHLGLLGEGGGMKVMLPSHLYSAFPIL